MNGKIAIITDTDSSLPESVARQYGIRQVPISIHFGAETFDTGVDIDDEKLFARVDSEGVLPTTSAPSPGKFVEAYQEAFDAGAEEIVCFTVSGAVSATYNAALNAAEQFEKGRVSVVDTKSLSMGQGFMVLAAAEAAQEGASSEQIIAIAESVRERTYLYAALPTLKYLAMSGRVGQLTAGMASLLNIKPILTIKDGKLDLLERVRTQRKAIGRVIELTSQAVNGRGIERMSMIHVNALDDAKTLEQMLRQKLSCPDDVIYASLTPGLSVHGGAGIVGVTIVVSE